MSAGASSAPSGAELAPPVAGVPLEQYAAVVAALADDFSVGQVLEIEGLTRDIWAEAELGWTRRLVEDGKLFARYVAELAAAEDRLERAVKPVSGDLDAWVRFLATYAEDPGALAAAQQQGLRLSDLSRLQRAWAKKMAADERLAERAQKLSEGIRPGPLSRMTFGDSRLLPSAAARARSEQTSDLAGPAEPPQVDRFLRGHENFLRHLVARPQAPPPRPAQPAAAAAPVMPVMSATRAPALVAPDPEPLAAEDETLVLLTSYKARPALPFGARSEPGHGFCGAEPHAFSAPANGFAGERAGGFSSPWVAAAVEPSCEETVVPLQRTPARAVLPFVGAQLLLDDGSDETRTLVPLARAARARPFTATPIDEAVAPAAEVAPAAPAAEVVEVALVTPVAEDDELGHGLTMTWDPRLLLGSLLEEAVATLEGASSDDEETTRAIERRKLGDDGT